MKKLIISAISLTFIFMLFRFPNLVFDGTSKGALLCKNTLLPSILPFMIVSSFMSLSKAEDFISLIFSPITKLLSLPKQLGGIWFSTLTGGFPSGAQAICSLYDLGEIDKSTAERLLPCCICSGPAFLILAVGKAMMGSMQLGVMLFLSQALSLITLCAVFAKSENKPQNRQKSSFMPLDAAFVMAVSKSVEGLISIFAFVIVFSVIIELLSVVPMLLPLSSLLEVTVGCKQLCELKRIFAVAFLTGFSGFSVCFQILTLAAKNDIYPKNFWLIRFLNGALCSVFFFFLTKFFPQAEQVYSSFSQQPFAVWSVNSVLGSVCFCAMIFMMLQRLEYKS